MFPWLISFVLLASTAFAEVGKISKVVGSGDAYILRNKEKITITVDASIEQGDELFTQDSVLIVYLYPTSQIGLAKNTQIKITQNLIEGTDEKDKSFSVIDFIKGLIRLQVTKEDNLEIEQKIVADGVAFAVRGTEFEVSQEGEDFDLDVIEGEVEVTSPYVNTFVPEIVKANEGFRFNKKSRNFQRRKFGAKFKNHPEFAKREEIRQKWKKNRLERKQKRLENKDSKTVKRADKMKRRTARTDGQRVRKERSKR
jgi:hypothetical protein